MRMPLLSVLLLSVLLAGCVGEGDTVAPPAALSAETPDAFLSFPNTQASLAAGSYTLQAGPAAGGSDPAAFHIVVTQDDGSSQTFDGDFSTGLQTLAPAIVLPHAGGLTVQARAAIPVRLVLQRNGRTVASGTDRLELAATQISSEAYARAYYRAVDPHDERDTLEKWKRKNGFYDTANPAVTLTHVTFRDALDLGYGRDMYVLRNSVTGRIAFMVQNYVVTLQPGSSSNYGPLNVDAAIARDVRYLKGTNAIEFSPANEDNAADPNGSMKITKFFTFNADGARLTAADLDGRGIKHMPGMCWACHGGQPLPLDPNGRFQAQALRSAKFNILGVGDFEYSLQDGYHRSQLEDRLRLLNGYVKESYELMQARDIHAAATHQGKWSADYALELVKGRYGNDFAGGRYDDSFVPAGWQDGPGRPAGTATLFRRVIAPHCAGCHALQGRAATHEPGTDDAANLGNAINFSSYEKFMAYRERIIDYVYKRGIMPLSLRNFERFWRQPDGAPALLAAMLNEPSLFDARGRVIPPGRPVARPGADRTVTAPVQLDGYASSFATRYHWSADSPSVSFSDPEAARPVMNAPDGSHVLTLTVSNALGSHSASVTYTVNSSARNPATLTFAEDIRPLFSAYGCTVCHAATGTAGIPVYWSDEMDSNGIRLYQRVLARVDLRDPENSRLLQKPLSSTHGGGRLLDTSTAQGRADYTTLLNWIREGAVCGSNPVDSSDPLHPVTIDVGCPQ